jgi:hypothetical protein
VSEGKENGSKYGTLLSVIAVTPVKQVRLNCSPIRRELPLYITLLGQEVKYFEKYFYTPGAPPAKTVVDPCAIAIQGRPAGIGGTTTPGIAVGYCHDAPVPINREVILATAQP